MIRTLLAGLLLATASFAVHAADFGMDVQSQLAARSMDLFGFGAPVAASAPATDGPFRFAEDDASKLVLLADGLSASFLSRDAANNLDMMAFYPAENPTHLIGCIEGDREALADGRLNPSVQAISLADGAVKTLVRGMLSCDGIRTTPWGTVLATEEEDDGGVYEIIDPLAIADVEVKDRATGEVSDPAHVAKRSAMAVIAWEGFEVTPEGVVYGGDELRPGTGSAGVDGGAIFKFIPEKAFAGGMISSLEASPLVAGKTYAMQVSCVDDKAQFGQGCEIGNALWIEIDPANARADADAKGATGYYRPEDLHADPMYQGEGIRFCGANTGNEGGKNYAEIICTTDTAPMNPGSAEAMTTVVNRFVEGDTEANSFDNLAFQPKTGILYVIEDHPNGDIWACLPDGADRDIKTDGCVRMLSVADSSAEPTGFLFADDGLTAYVSIQHSFDGAMSDVDGYATDDLVKITGFKAPGM